MARPALPIGAWGEINYTTRSGKPAAYARFRDYDGVSRPVLRTGASKAKAKTALLEALADRSKPSLGDINRDTKLRELADIYEAEMERDSKLGPQTKNNYKSKLKTIRVGLGGVTIAEATPARLDRFVQAVATKHPGAARMVRTVLKNMMMLAVLHEAVDRNPVVETRAVARAVPNFSALRAPQLMEIRVLLQQWDRKPIGRHPRNGSLTDATDMYLATGTRTAELLAFDWPSLDLLQEPYEATVDKTVIKNTAGKLEIQHHTKNHLIRRLELPNSVASMLIRRRVNATCDLVFPSQAGTLRWPDSLRRDWRDALRGSEYEGLKLGLYRKSVATHIADRLGVEAARDQLGHTGLANLKYYVEPAKRGPEAAAVIDELFQQSAD
ncbi:site-specific integrase [Leucobacter allii]|uniref:Site-specific integrase n=1 Tax=Leucobacter allii TaxID=2932247 RepID=A0ABY4FLN8_9MICO|nr:site-specific integrase [Leucobacter allii]UOQ57202.1 site-specific integrase [Leucobacter allii]